MRSLAGLSLTACAAAAALALAATDRVHAAGTELIEAIGEPLRAYSNARHDDGLRTLIVNGARLRLRSGTTTDGIDVVLDNQSASCRPIGAEHNPIVRTRRADQGLAGCVVPRQGQHWIEGVRAWIASQDLAALGELRVTWAMTSPHGTRYVTVASDGPLVLPEMFPEDGDAPGFDLPALPRPPEARRLLSTWQHGATPLLLSYQSTLPLRELQTRYAEVLGAHVERVPGTGPNERALWVRRENHQYLATLAADGRETLISIIALASDATAPEAAR